jgi:thiamine-phosphate pyrophosphorylase
LNLARVIGVSVSLSAKLTALDSSHAVSAIAANSAASSRLHWNRLLYAITDRRLYAPDEESRRVRLLDLTSVWANHGVRFIQLREKDLGGRELVELARGMLKAIQGAPSGRPYATRLLVNGRADVALAAGADGVHLPSGADALAPDEVRSIFSAAGRAQPPCISISCHTLPEVEAACQQQPDCILFAPVFEKVIAEKQTAGEIGAIPGAGLQLLKQACNMGAPTPVLALGGVTAENAQGCIPAGAAGIAAIRLMLEPVSTWQKFI